MRTSAWVVVLLAAGGCTSNGIFLETVTDDGGTSDTAGSGDGTETSPPADSGSDEGPQPECEEDWECGECGSCFEGTCQDHGGCCSAEPDEPFQWRCSPPVECFDDNECAEGQICVEYECVPDPDTEVIEPPLCAGDVALVVEQLALDIPLSYVAVAELGATWGLGPDLGPVMLDLVEGPTPPLGELEGDVARDLLGAGVLTVAAITERSTPEGLVEHAIGSALGGGDASSVDAGPWVPGSVQAAAWSGASQELWVGSGARIERWSIGELASVGELELDLEVRALAAAALIGDGMPVMAVALADGSVRLLDPATGALVLATDDVLAGQAVDLVDHGWNVLAVHAIAPDANDEAGRTGIHTLQADATLDAIAPPFGAPGTPLEAAAIEIDGDGIDDVVVATADGRLDVYLMQEVGARCRVYLPLGSILDLEAGDVDGDGDRDVIVVDAGPTVTAILGVAAP